MKKYSLITRENSRRTSSSKKIAIAVTMALTLSTLVFFAPRILSTFGSFVFLPVHSFHNWLSYSTDTFPLYFRERSALIAELDKFKYDASAQSGDALTIELLRKENEELRSLLGNKKEERVLAGVTLRPPFLPYDVLVIDRGSKDGIVEGAPVFVDEYTVIGIVDQVFLGSSVVVLATTNGFKSSVFISGPDIYTTAVGQGGGVMRIGVPQGIALSEGNLVILPGVDSGVYGKVEHINSIATEAEQEAFVSPSASLQSIRYVSVGKSTESSMTYEEAHKRVLELKASFLAPIPDGVLIISSSTKSTSTSTTPP